MIFPLYLINRKMLLSTDIVRTYAYFIILIHYILKLNTRSNGCFTRLYIDQNNNIHHNIIKKR